MAAKTLYSKLSSSRNQGKKGLGKIITEQQEHMNCKVEDCQIIVFYFLRFLQNLEFK